MFVDYVIHACVCVPIFPAARDIDAVAEQYPFEPAVFKRVRLTFFEVIELLQDNGYPDVSRVLSCLGVLARRDPGMLI